MIIRNYKLLTIIIFRQLVGIFGTLYFIFSEILELYHDSKYQEVIKECVF